MEIMIFIVLALSLLAGVGFVYGCFLLGKKLRPVPIVSKDEEGV